MATSNPDEVRRMALTLDVHGAGESSPSRCERHCGIFNIHQLMSADKTSSLKSIRQTVHTHIDESPYL